MLYFRLTEKRDLLGNLLPEIYRDVIDHQKILKFASHKSADGVLVCDETERPLAFLLVQLAGDTADIIDIGTAVTSRGQGIATSLLQHYLDNMRDVGVAKLYLEVAVDNVPAIALYKRAGFIEIGKRIGYYQRQETTGRLTRIDAVQMQYVI